jgi:hypothetical protein
VLTKRFTFLCNDDEQLLLQAVSKRLKRSQSNTVRFLITAAAEELGLSRVVFEDHHIQVTEEDEQTEVLQ